VQRDHRLQGLSSDHHHALVLARDIQARPSDGTADAGLALRVAREFAQDLEPHFAVEEQLLLPAVRGLGEHDLAEEVLADHAFLRAHATAIADGLTAGLDAFAARLVQHVRLEEGELFPLCEQRLPALTLDKVAQRRPKPRPGTT
jgi:hemerythrin-like domain-containing protein